MNPKYRPAILMAISFVLMAPLMVFMLYCSTHFPQSRWPMWATNTIAIWFTANFLILMLVLRKLGKLFGKQTTDPEKARRSLSIAQTRVTGLVVVWSGFFLYGGIKTVQGKIPLARAIPAGAFLLFFIALFGWSLYQSRRKRA